MNAAEFAAARKTVTTPYGEIAYVERGSGPTALFVHGVILNGYLWHDVIDELEPQRRCIAMDLMGHGYSRVADDQDLSFAAQAAMLESFVDALGLGQVDLVANNSGGGIAQIFAATHPERIRTMTLTNCDTHDNLFPPAVVPLFDVIRAGKLLDIFKPMLASTDTARNGFGSSLEHPDQLSDETIRAFLEPLVANEEASRSCQRWIQALDVEDMLRIEPQLRELNAPTLIVWGTGDVFFDVEWAYWLRRAIPGAVDVIEVPGAKLFFPLEHPKLLVEKITDFWAEHSAPRAGTMSGGGRG
jgi:pimeloyl-ACP methyl ester carboxylesterase